MGFARIEIRPEDPAHPGQQLGQLVTAQCVARAGELNVAARVNSKGAVAKPPHIEALDILLPANGRFGDDAFGSAPDTRDLELSHAATMPCSHLATMMRPAST